MHLVSHPLPLIKDNLCVLSFPLPTTPPGRLLPSKHARTGQYQHCPAHNRRYGHPKGPVYLPYGLHTGKRGGPAPRPHRAPYRLPVPAPYRFAHTGPVPFARNGPKPFCPYRPRSVLSPCCHYKPLPTHTAPVPPPYRFARTAAVPFCPYRPRTVLSPCCPYKALLLFLSSLLLFCLDAFRPKSLIPKVKILRVFYSSQSHTPPFFFFFLSFLSFLDHHTQKSRSRQSGNRNKSRDDCSHSMPVFC